MLSIDFDIGNIVLEDSGDVDLDHIRCQNRFPLVACRGKRISLLQQLGWFVVRRLAEPRSLDHAERRMLTSGKVPLEKTLFEDGGLV